MTDNQIASKGKAEEIDKLVGKNIKYRRVILGLSQHEIGKAINVSIQQIQKYEKATNRISSGKLYSLAKFLRVPLDYFFGKENNNQDLIYNMAEEQDGYEEKDQKANESSYEKEVMTLIKYFRGIDDQDVRNKVLSLVKTMSSRK